MRPIFTLSTLFVCLLSAAAVGADDAAALLKTIQSAETPDVDRANAFEKIGDVAGEEAVESLVGFLGDEKWSHYARYSLQKMEGQVVTDALTKALDTLQGDLKLGVIGTIGRRRDPSAVAPLVRLLADADAKVADLAAVALGWIGTPNAAAALTEAFDAATDSKRKESLGSALLLAGQRLAKMGNRQAAIRVFDLLRDADLSKACRIGAIQNAILARGARGVDLMVEQLKSSDLDHFQTGLAASRVLPGESATKSLAGLLETESSPDRQVLLIQAIKDRDDRLALPAVLAMLKSDSTAVQLAAVDAIGSLGNGSSAPILLSVANDATAEAVLDSLVALEGANVNAALMKAAEPPDMSTVALSALGRRRAKEAVDLFFQLSAADRPAISEQAIAALGMTAPQDRFLDLLALLKTAKSDARKATIQTAIHGAVFRSTQPDACAEALCAMIPSASGADREFLFEQVRTAGGARAVARMREFATGLDEALQDAATKTLGRWLSADAAPVLLEVAQGDGKFADRAMGGYIRIFRQFELPEAERVAMAAKALKVARRSSERNAAIDAMTRFPCVGTFELALGQLDAPGSEAAAAKAVLTIARTVLDLDPEKGEAGLERLIDANISKSVTDSAKALLQ
ncbi:MAG: HEAT repeat domain-containing protein [Planctomycetes bacterium]|nr:HEAT repeat domain-containing protein [Planctomycetota bacterium]